MEASKDKPPLTYLDKVFNEPRYIWQAGVCDLNEISKTLETQHAPRMKWLSSSPDTSSSGPSKPLPTNSGKPATPTVAGDSSIRKLPQSSAPTKPPPADPTALPAPSDVDTSGFTVTKYAIAPLVSSVWNGAEPQNYQAQFQIGTEPVTFYLDIDTGSSILWVQSHLANSDATILDQSMYTPSSSTTSQDLKDTKNIAYGDGSRVSANIYSDIVIMQPLIANGQYIGAVSTTTLPASMVRSKSNGLIGLGFPPDKNNFVQTLKVQKKLKYSSITMVGPRNDPKAAAEIDKKAVMEPRGSLVIGSVDPSFYTGDIAWCKQVPYGKPAVLDRWVVKLDAVLINDKVVFKDQLALIDTGTAYMLVSRPTYASVKKAIRGAVDTDKKILFMYPPDSLSSMSFVLGGRPFKLHPEDFSLGEVRQNETGKWACSSICTLRDSWQFPDNLWVLGGIFLDNVVTIFDFADSRVGFADINEADLPPAPAPQNAGS